MREDFIRQGSVMHVLLNSEVVDSDAKVQGCRHSDGGKVCGSVESSSHMIESCEIRGLPGVSDASAMHDCHSDVVNPLTANQIVGIPEGVEDLASRDWSDRVPADQFEAFLELRWAGVFHPEKVIGLE